MDTQIWYSVFCTLFGGVYGILHHLGEVSCASFFSLKGILVPVLLLFCTLDSDFRNVEKSVSQFAFCIQYFPYPTLIKKWSKEKNRLLSQ